MPRSGEPVERKPRRSKRGNGEGSIYLRKDGQWTAAYFVPRPGGGESRRYVYGRSPEEVETKLVEIRKQVRSGAPLAPAGLTVARYLSEWMEQLAAPRVRPNTARSYRDLIAKYLVPKLGRKRLGQLGARDVRQFLAALAADGVGERTAQLAHAVLRAALEDAMREEIIPRNVAKLVRAPRPAKQDREPLTVEQVRALLTSTRDHRLHALFVVFAVLGLRRSEALGLRWEDVDLEAGVLRMRRSLHRVDGQLATFPTKTQRSTRAVPLPGLVARALTGSPAGPGGGAAGARGELAQLGLRLHHADRHAAGSTQLHSARPGPVRGGRTAGDPAARPAARMRLGAARPGRAAPNGDGHRGAQHVGDDHDGLRACELGRQAGGAGSVGRAVR